MQRFGLFLLAILAGSGFAQDAVQQEAIGQPGEIFTADEFREHLQALRDRRSAVHQIQKMLEKESTLTPQQHKELMEFAQRLLEKSQSGGDKKDLRIPPSLLRNPAIQKMLNDEAFLEHLLENKALMDLAERLVERYRLPRNLPGQGQLPLPGAGRPGGASRQPGTGQVPSERQGQPPSESSPGPSADGRQPPDSSLPGGEGRGEGPGPGARQPPTPAERQPSKSDPAAAGREGQGGRGQENGERPRLDPAKQMLRDATQTMRRLGLEDSQTLNRIEERLTGRSSPGGQLGDLSPPPLWEELQKQFEETPLSQWTNRLDGDRFADLVPEGWDRWLPSVDSIPIPPLPNVNVGWMTPPIPPMPDVRASIPSGRQAGMGVLVMALGAAAIIATMLLRQRLEPILAARRGGAAAVALRPPLGRFDATDRKAVREWFEFLAFRWLGPKASVHHHKAIVDSLRNAGRCEADPAGDLARLYEEARYSPPADPLSPDAIRKAAASYDRLTKGT